MLQEVLLDVHPSDFFTKMIASLITNAPTMHQIEGLQAIKKKRPMKAQEMVSIPSQQFALLFSVLLAIDGKKA